MLRGVILWGALVWPAPQPPYVMIGPPVPVETAQPITCVHTRLTDEVEEWKIQRSLQLVREMGAATIVEFFPWAYMEPVKGEYWWGHADMVIAHARAQGLTVIARMGTVPTWARPDPDETGQDTSLNYLDDAHMEDFAEFVEAFARRYRGQVDHLIIWNEPNLAFEWGYQPVDPARYVRLLEVVTPAARRGNPGVVILAGALAPTLEPVGSPHGMNDLEYLRRLYEAGFAAHFDVLAVHSYGFKFPPDDPPDPEVLNFRRVELLRAVMEQYGDGGKPVIITESGWNDHPRWTRAVTPSQRIVYTVGALEYAVEHWPWAEHVCLWALRYPTPTRSYPDYFTLVSVDFTPRPIYYEIQAWARGWSQGAN
ncbi:MAG: hypothetical protein Kow00124_07600 [Anaerolineae bacterium]